MNHVTPKLTPYSKTFFGTKLSTPRLLFRPYIGGTKDAHRGGTSVAKKPVGPPPPGTLTTPATCNSGGDGTDDEEVNRMGSVRKLASTEDNRAYADPNNNVNRHVEAQEIEEGSQSGIGSVDSSSETSASNVAGAFTLELLGKGIRATNRKIKPQKKALTGDSAGPLLRHGRRGLDTGGDVSRRRRR